MALIRYGGGIIQMSGSIAGNTFARNRFGNYSRARTKPVNPKSNRQMAARTIIMYLAEQWRESPMDDTIRIAWQTYADSVDWLNKLGETVTLTGFNMFMRANASLLAAGGVIVTAAPTDLGLPPGDPLFAVTGSAATQLLSVTFDENFDWIDEDLAYMLIDMGLPQSPSRNFFGGPYRISDAIEGNSTTPPTAPETMTAPFTLVEGQKVWCRASIIRADGRVSTKFGAAPFAVSA